ncbi:MAG: NAD-dependent epimerase/dehydratase family protein [Nitrospiraceae bacterium]|nr:MAG: NAD-dependent epimerase/dehydratase family protein [Nitrospiraceae bacterium]
MKALITGATGFIGSHLAEALIGRGYDVSCLVRKTSSLKWLDGLEIGLVEGDCCDAGSLRGIKDFDYVFHLAGLTKAHRTSDFYTVNSVGTENIIEAVAGSGRVKRFVYLSSLSAFGPNMAPHIPTEDEAPHPVSDYGRSKLRGETAVLMHADKIPVTVLRPSVVYGPRERDFLWLFRMVKRGLLPYRGNGHLSLIYVNDLINAIILSAENENAAGKTYFVSDGTVYSNDEIIDEIASALGVRVLKIKAPEYFFSAIGFFGDRISSMTGRSVIFNGDKIKEIMYAEWVCDITRINNELCFQPGTKLRQGVKWTADWYRTRNWL